MERIFLKGITWGHSRGITPLLAAAQRFSEIYPEVEISWTKRTLQEFADFPIEKLTTQYDLLIIDHPWVGCASATKCVLPLEEYLSTEYLAEQLCNSVGSSHLSYQYEGHQWALAIDAATPVACYRADLFDKINAPAPETWQEVLRLAKGSKVAIPSIPIDLLMHFYMFCIAEGKVPFGNETEVVDQETGLRTLDTMKELWSLVDKKMFEYNPIAVAELMASTDTYCYCPFTYGYSNYSRKGYGKYMLTYGDLVTYKPNQRLRSTIGGTGIAVSSSTNNRDWAVQFARWVASADIQAGLYVQNGGQPAHHSAWNDTMANYNCNYFFLNTLPALNRAYQRPRYNGYLCFQDRAGALLQSFLLHGARPGWVLEEMNQLYRNSKQQ